MSCFVGLRIYVNFVYDINCLQTYIYLLLIAVLLLFIVIFISFISVIYSLSCEN